MGKPITTSDIVAAIEQVSEYLSDESENYAASTKCEKLNHIWLAVRTLMHAKALLREDEKLFNTLTIAWDDWHKDSAGFPSEEVIDAVGAIFERSERNGYGARYLGKD